MDYYDLGAYSRPITTKSAEAQVWFDRGLNWVFGFNHAEAIKCFGKAAEHDPGCAMAQWGIAYAAGPNYNLPWHFLDPGGRVQALAVAYDATHQALAVADGASAVEGGVMIPDRTISGAENGLASGSTSITAGAATGGTIGAIR